jgi:hypothetical protein
MKKLFSKFEVPRTHGVVIHDVPLHGYARGLIRAFCNSESGRMHECSPAADGVRTYTYSFDCKHNAIGFRSRVWEHFVTNQFAAELIEITR